MHDANRWHGSVAALVMDSAAAAQEHSIEQKQRGLPNHWRAAYRLREFRP
jgi:hypothetical protein